MSPKNDLPELEAPSTKPSSGNKFLLFWFAIPIILVIVIGFLKN